MAHVQVEEITITAQLVHAQTSIESFLSGLPSEVSGFIQGLLSPFTELLEYVSGDPDDLIRAAQAWATAGETLATIHEEQRRDVTVVTTAWKEGEDLAAFTETMRQVDELFDGLNQAFDGTKDLLVQAADAAVAAFNLLIDLIVELLIWWATDLILAAALTVVSFGASWIAAGVKATAEALAGMARAGRIAAKLAEILTKISEFLKDIKMMCEMYRIAIMELHEMKKGYKLLNLSKEALAFKSLRAVTLLPGTLTFNAVSPVNLPGLTKVGQDAYSNASKIPTDVTYPPASP